MKKLFLFLIIGLIALSGVNALNWYSDVSSPHPYWKENNAKDITINDNEKATLATNTFDSIDDIVHLNVNIYNIDGVFVNNVDSYDVDVSEYTGFEEIEINKNNYVNAGDYRVVVTLSDSYQSQTDYATLKVNSISQPPVNPPVEPPVQPPINPPVNPPVEPPVQPLQNRAPHAAVIASPQIGNSPLNVQFSSTGSSDPDNNQLTYTWNFGDGTTSNQANPNHIYTNNGNNQVYYVVSLTVSDGSLIDIAQVIITVNPQIIPPPVPGNEDPVAILSIDRSQTCKNVAINFDGSWSYDMDGTIEFYSWDFGDGNSASGPSVSNSYSSDGNYLASLTVTDNQGATNSAYTFIEIGGIGCFETPQENRDTSDDENYGVNKFSLNILNNKNFVAESGKSFDFDIQIINTGETQDDVKLFTEIIGLDVKKVSMISLSKNSNILKNIVLDLPKDAKGEYIIKVELNSDGYNDVAYMPIKIIGKSNNVNIEVNEVVANVKEVNNWPLIILLIILILASGTGLYFMIKKVMGEK